MRIIARGFVLSRSRLVSLLRFLFFKHPFFLRRASTHRHCYHESERESLRCCTTMVTNARTACVVCFDLLSHLRKYFFTRPIRKSKSVGKKQAFQYLSFLLPRDLRTVRTCMRACVRACVRAAARPRLRAILSRGQLRFIDL